MSDSSEKVKKIVVEHLGVEADKVTEEASFIDDLGADSLDIVELVMAFEEEFGVEIPDDAAKRTATVKEAIDYIEANRGYRPAVRPGRTRRRRRPRVSGFPVPSARAQRPGSFFYAPAFPKRAPMMLPGPGRTGTDERNDYAPGCGDGIGFGDAAGRRCGNHMGQSARRQIGRGPDHPFRRVRPEMHHRVRGQGARP